MKMLRTIPALPVRHMDRSVEFYRDKLRFTLIHREDGFAIFRRDAAEIHVWAASDEAWRARDGTSPVVSGAESFIAGTASCRVEVEGVDELYRELRPLGILEPDAQPRDQWWGSREFHVKDPDNNLVTLFESK
jgi:catechol 2,3-dioxygenase-like lactoylglutathione lyase family enzyme